MHPFFLNAGCGRFFFNPHICGKYADLKGICDHFQFQNAYMQPLNCQISHGKFTAKFSLKIKNENLKILDYCGRW